MKMIRDKSRWGSWYCTSKEPNYCKNECDRDPGSSGGLVQEIAWDAVVVWGLLPSGTLRSRNPSDPRIIDNGSSSSIAFMQHSRKKNARNVLNELDELLHIIALAVILSPLRAYPSMELPCSIQFL